LAREELLGYGPRTVSDAETVTAIPYRKLNSASFSESGERSFFESGGKVKLLTEGVLIQVVGDGASHEAHHLGAVLSGGHLDAASTLYE